MSTKSMSLVGYVLTESSDSPARSTQIKKIESTCRELDYDLVYLEKEVSSSKSLIRVGLWRAVRRLICNQCELKSMPLSFLGADDWMKEVLTSCACGQMAGLDGLIVATIDCITPIAREGSRFALTLARIGKHLIIAPEQKCVSCCNPAAISLLHKGGI